MKTKKKTLVVDISHCNMFKIYLSTFHDNEDIVKEIEKGKCWNASSGIYRKEQHAIQY